VRERVVGEATAESADGREGRGRFAHSPLLVIWEVSRACDLACVHCRAMAIPGREAWELTTGEGRRLVADIRRFGRPIFVLTGGDPLKRDDIFDLIEAGATAGLPTHLSPSGTPLLTHAALHRAREAGLDGVSISIDGSTAEIHDRFRGVPGAFGWSLDGAAAAAGLGLALQINTTLTPHNLDDLPAIADLVGALEARRWSLFLLVPTGRAGAAMQIGAAACERVFRWLHALSRTAPFRIKTTEGPHYRRVALQAGGGRFVPGMNDGSGFVFVSARGDIQPSGFLPVTAGNVRRDDLVRVYREHPLFVMLRDPDRLKGRCGRCEYRALCGGSRARAWAAGGDLMGEDPACSYEPAGVTMEQSGEEARRTNP
jgi:radical SAM protein with 4Fe4S-binding SPASM domain